MSESANRTVEIINKRGLHARASAKFVKLASGFDAEVRVSKDGQTVDARSIMGLMMLAAAQEAGRKYCTIASRVLTGK